MIDPALKKEWAHRCDLCGTYFILMSPTPLSEALARHMADVHPAPAYAFEPD